MDMPYSENQKRKKKLLVGPQSLYVDCFCLNFQPTNSECSPNYCCFHGGKILSIYSLPNKCQKTNFKNSNMCEINSIDRLALIEAAAISFLWVTAQLQASSSLRLYRSWKVGFWQLKENPLDPLVSFGIAIRVRSGTRFSLLS